MQLTEGRVQDVGMFGIRVYLMHGIYTYLDLTPDRPHARGERGAVAAGHPMLCAPAPGARCVLLADLVA